MIRQILLIVALTLTFTIASPQVFPPSDGCLLLLIDSVEKSGDGNRTPFDPRNKDIYRRISESTFKKIISQIDKFHLESNTYDWKQTRCILTHDGRIVLLIDSHHCLYITGDDKMGIPSRKDQQKLWLKLKQSYRSSRNIKPEIRKNKVK